MKENLVLALKKLSFRNMNDFCQLTRQLGLNKVKFGLPLPPNCYAIELLDSYYDNRWFIRCLCSDGPRYLTKQYLWSKELYNIYGTLPTTTYWLDFNECKKIYKRLLPYVKKQF